MIMNKKKAIERNIRLARLMGLFFLLLCALFVYAVFSYGGWILAAALFFAFSSMGVYSVWVYFKVRKLEIADGTPFFDTYRMVMNSIGGIKTMMLVVFGVTCGTVGIITLGTI